MATLTCTPLLNVIHSSTQQSSLLKISIPEPVPQFSRPAQSTAHVAYTQSYLKRFRLFREPNKLKIFPRKINLPLRSPSSWWVFRPFVYQGQSPRVSPYNCPSLVVSNTHNFICPFICQWTTGFISPLAYYENAHSECANIFSRFWI